LFTLRQTWLAERLLFSATESSIKRGYPLKTGVGARDLPRKARGMKNQLIKLGTGKFTKQKLGRSSY